MSASPDAPAAAPAADTTTVVEAAPAATPATSTPAAAAGPDTTTVTAPPAKRSLKDGLLNRVRGTDLEKGLTSDDPDAKRKRKLAAAGLLGTLLTLLGVLLGTMLLSVGSFIIASYVFPMLTCKMHGYNSNCMFNDWDKKGTSVGEWLSSTLPSGMGRGFHSQGW